jgi:hypothetical protein
LAAIASVLLLLPLSCSLKPANRCDCPRPEYEELTDAEFHALLAEAVEEGYVEEGSREYRKIEKEIENGTFSHHYFGGDWRDLGIEPDAVWTVPSTINQNCPFEIHWRICFQAEECRVATPAETGEISHGLVIERVPADLEVDYGIGELRRFFGHESLVAGECFEYVYEHSGLEEADLWEIIVAVFDIGYGYPLIDCEGKTGPDVKENDERRLQIEVGCYCGDQEWYGVAVSALSHFPDSEEVQWRISFDWEQCRDSGPGTKSFEERIQITRASDGVLVVDATTTFTLMMGSSIDRSTSTAGLEPNEEYELTVEISGDECSCNDVDLTVDNQGSLSFSL